MSSFIVQAPGTGTISDGATVSGRKTQKLGLGKSEACHQCRKQCDAERPCCSNCRRTHNKMIRVNPHFSHIEPNCTYNDGIQPRDIEEKLSAENLRNLEARVEELEELMNSENSKNEDRTRTPRFPLGFQSPFGAFLYNESENAGPTHSMSYGLPLVTDEWPTSLPPKQLVLHLVDLFFNCWSNSRRILHRPTFLLALLEPPSSPRFPYVGLLHAICAAGAIYSPFVTVTPLPPITNRPVDEIFMSKTQLLNDRVLAFDEENFLLAKYQCMDSANMGEHLLEVIQACLINSWWAFSCGRWFDVWAMSGLASRLCVALGLNLYESIHEPIPDKIRNQLLIGPPRSHVEVELRRNVFWLVYAIHRFHLAATPFPFDINDEDVHQILPGTLDAFEAGVDGGQMRQSAFSADLFTTHNDDLDDFGLYIKGAIMISRARVLQERSFRKCDTEQEIRDSKEMEIAEAVISSFKASTLRGRFNPTEQPSSTAISNLYMVHTLPHLTIILSHHLIANWSDPSCESANKSLAAARAILRYTTGLASASWDCARIDKAATLCWYLAGKVLLLALRHAPDSLAPILRAEIRLLRKSFLIGNGRIMVFARQRFAFDSEAVEQLGGKEAALLSRETDI